MSYKVFIGVDVGRNSAMAVREGNKITVHKISMLEPKEASERVQGILDTLKGYKKDEVCITVEAPFCNVMQSKSSVQKLGISYGWWLATCYLLSSHTVYTVTANVWTSRLLLNGLSKSGRLLMLAELLERENIELVHEGKLSHDGADATAIALYASKYPNKLRKTVNEGWYA